MRCPGARISAQSIEVMYVQQLPVAATQATSNTPPLPIPHSISRKPLLHVALGKTQDSGAIAFETRYRAFVIDTLLVFPRRGDEACRQR